MLDRQIAKAWWAMRGAGFTAAQANAVLRVAALEEAVQARQARLDSIAESPLTGMFNARDTPEERALREQTEMEWQAFCLQMILPCEPGG